MLFLTLLLFPLSVLSKCASEDFYYWRDFYGVIPSDAFPAGSDAEGNPTYIGQTYMPERNHLLPTIITPGEKSAFLIVGKERWAGEKRTKILCSTNNNNFRWIPTDIKKLKLLTGCRLVDGGWNPNGVLFSIGRINVQGRTLTGRVSEVENGLRVHNENFHELATSDFEILTFNCKNPWVEEIAE